jgi:hypothetical protein
MQSNLEQTRRSLPRGWLLAAQKRSSWSTLSSRSERAPSECPILEERDSVPEHPEPIPRSTHAPTKLSKMSYSLTRGRKKPSHYYMVKMPCRVPSEGETTLPEWCKNLQVSKLSNAKTMNLEAQDFKGEVQPRKIIIHMAGPN